MAVKVWRENSNQSIFEDKIKSAFDITIFIIMSIQFTIEYVIRFQEFAILILHCLEIEILDTTIFLIL